MYGAAVLAVSVIPAFAFLAYIMYMDRREPEPLGFVLRVAALGSLSALAALLAEILLDRAPLFHGEGLGPLLLVSFVQVAPVEEACKLGVVLLFVWRSPYFNEENDGIVYTGASALGFALLENLAYVFENGIGTGILRAFSAMPLHVFTGVILGYHVGIARFAASRDAARTMVGRGFAVAYLLHGVYDALALSGSAAALLLLPLLAGVAAFGVIFLQKGRKLSLARWLGFRGSEAGGTPSVAALETAAPRAASPRARKAPIWMAAISRSLLLASGLFWLLLFLGIYAPETGPGTTEAVLGGVLLTAIPLSLGVVLEAGYRRRKRRWKAARAEEPGARSGGATA